MSSRFEELQREGKRLAAEGRLHESLHKFELARKIKETSKILNRIQKLKVVIGQGQKKELVKKSEQSFPQNSAGSIGSSEKISGILNDIQNIEVKYENPERLKSFNELKNKAIELAYEGKFEEALDHFSEAHKIYDGCPKLNKYIQDLEIIVSKYPKKLEEFRNLIDNGKKLASAGKETESLEKLKNAFAVCPSPTVFKMIKKIETKSTSPETPVFSPSSFKEPLAVKTSGKDDENSLASGSKTTSVDSVGSVDLSPESKEYMKQLYNQAREHAAVGQLQKALDVLEKARSICPTDKVLKRIQALKDHMKQISSESSDDMKEISNGFFVFHEIYDKLYPYQREGVAWMWKLFKMKKGGILGDDMGLGKTFQVIAFLSGLIDADMIKYALIIMPVSLLPNWEKEFKKWCPGISVSLFHGTSKKERECNLLRVQRRGHVLLTSYGMVLNALNLLNDFEGRPFVWDYVILDEGHKIKNPTKTAKAVHAIPSKNRLVLTGTPVQNNLLELWALYDFAHQGTLLGSLKTFKMQYENIITRAREKDSSVGEKRLGTEMAENLKMLIKPFFLRRTKSEIWTKEPESAESINGLDKEMEQLSISENKLNSRKNDLIVWTFLSEAQCDIYRDFLHSEAVKTILVSKRSPLVELTTLKKICDHPRLLSQRACLQLGLNGDINEEDLQRELNEESSYSSSIEHVSDETLMAESGKMKFLINLLGNLKNEGHRTLVFSLSRKILDMIHRILINRQWKVLRIDGTISKISERERRIQLFQNDSSYSVFLLTTQVGGVGITLTAADRVVIYDPSWNPATDAQAVDRVYRIGQQKNVIVYRLITCGTVEEKIYRRQIFKDSITKQATSSSDPYRYFSKQELRELFTFDNPHHSATQVQLSQLHSHQRMSDTQLDAHIAFLYSLDIFGISDHDLMFSREIQDNTEDTEEAGFCPGYIQKQVAAAQELIQTEASVIAEGIRLAGTFSRPYSENISAPRNPKQVSLVSKGMSSIFTVPKPEAPSQNYPTVISNQSSNKFASNGIKNFVSTPERISVGHGNNISKYVSPTEENMIHEDSTYEACKVEVDEFTSFIELSNDVKKNNSQISPKCKMDKNQSCEFASNEVEIVCNRNSDANTPTLFANESIDQCTNISKNTSCTSSASAQNIYVQYSESKKESDYEDPNVDEADSVILLSSDDEMNNYSPIEEKLSINNNEQIISAKSKHNIQSDHNLNGEDNGIDQHFSSTLIETKENTRNYLSNLNESSIPSTPPRVESELVQKEFDSVWRKKLETLSDGSTASLSNHELTSNNSESTLSQKNDDESYIENKDFEISDPSGFSAAPKTSEFISRSSVSPIENKHALEHLGLSSAVNETDNDLMADLSFDDTLRKPKRKSCALAKTFAASDSESSCPTSPSKEDPDDILVSTDSEDCSVEEDHSSSSLCFVPSSIPNSPALGDKTFRNRVESPRRITPLKVRKSLCPSPDRAFAQALASSPIIQQPRFYSDSEEDSPVKVHRNAGRKKNFIESSDED